MHGTGNSALSTMPQGAGVRGEPCVEVEVVAGGSLSPELHS